MHRRASIAAAAAGTLVLVSSLIAALPASAQNANAGTSYTWVGASQGLGDGHSWKDPQNWRPAGVPANNDSVSIDASGKTCTIAIDGVPGNVRLHRLSMQTEKECSASVRGGAITVLGSLQWQGGTIRSALSVLPRATALISPSDAQNGPVVGDELFVQGLVEVAQGRGLLQVAPNAEVAVLSGGDLQVDPGALVSAQACCDKPSVLDFSNGGTVSVPADKSHAGKAKISGLLVRDVLGTIDVAPGSTLLLAEGPRGSLTNDDVQGGGTLMLADPMDADQQTTLADDVHFVLLPGGSIDGDFILGGAGSFDWRGGVISGVDAAFAPETFTVSGPHPKVIGDVQPGFFSNVEINSDTTLASGTSAHPNVLDMGGNAFEVFFSTLTISDHVLLKDGDITSSQGNYDIDPGSGGVVTAEADVTVEVPQQLDVASGTFVVRGLMRTGLVGSAVVVDKGARLRLTDPANPLLLQDGTLTGRGEVDGAVHNTSGIFEPYNAGSDVPLTLHGSYIQDAGATMLLDLQAGSRPMRLSGSASVLGTVTYINQADYEPAVGAHRSIITAADGLTWAPGCEQTTGSESDTSHWASAQMGTTARAVFRDGPGGDC